MPLSDQWSAASPIFKEKKLQENRMLLKQKRAIEGSISEIEGDLQAVLSQKSKVAINQLLVNEKRRLIEVERRLEASYQENRESSTI